MKSILTLLVGLGLVAGAAYLGAPVYLERQTAPLRERVATLEKNLAETTAWLEEEKRVRETGVVPEDAGLADVIQNLNRLAERAAALETAETTRGAEFENLKQTLVSNVNQSLDSAKRNVQDEMNVFSHSVDERQQAAEGRVHAVWDEISRLQLAQSVFNVMGHLSKAKGDVLERNLGKALQKIDLATGKLALLEGAVPQDRREAVTTALTTIRLLRVDVDAGRPSAVERLDLLWEDLERLAGNFAVPETRSDLSEARPPVEPPRGAASLASTASARTGTADEAVAEPVEKPTADQTATAGEKPTEPGTPAP